MAASAFVHPTLLSWLRVATTWTALCAVCGNDVIEGSGTEVPLEPVRAFAPRRFVSRKRP